MDRIEPPGGEGVMGVMKEGVLKKVVIYSTRFCPFCIRARALLESKGLAFEDVPVDGDPPRRREMVEKSGRYTVPQIWVGDTHVGGCDELYALEQAGKLDQLVTVGETGNE